MPGCRLIGVGQDEDPEPLVRRADLCRREQARRRRVAQSPKVSQDGFKAEGDVTGDVFEEYPFEAGAKFARDPCNIRPEVPLVICATALSSMAERLAWVSGKQGVECPGKWPGIECGEVIPDWCWGEISGALSSDEG